MVLIREVSVCQWMVAIKKSVYAKSRQTSLLLNNGWHKHLCLTNRRDLRQKQYCWTNRQCVFFPIKLVLKNTILTAGGARTSPRVCAERTSWDCPGAALSCAVLRASLREHGQHAMCAVSPDVSWRALLHWSCLHKLRGTFPR